MIERWVGTLIWRLTLSAAALLMVLLGVFLLLLALGSAPPSVRTVVAVSIVAVIVLVVIGTAVTGIAVTAVTPPLRPIAETSILGRRVMAFAKFGFAVAALFATAFVSWIVAKTYDYYYDRSLSSADPTGQLAASLGSVIGIAAFVFWTWLSIDL